MLKPILKIYTPPEWKEADEIVPGVWLGTLTENEHARRRNISKIICISKEPQADLQREGFRNAPDLKAITFTIESDTEGDVLSMFEEVCDVIDRYLADAKGVLMWDVGGGVATLAAYIMKKHALGLAEAMTTMTRARLKREKPPIVPSKRIIDMLHNDTYQSQLDMWQACSYDLVANAIVNPSEPREKWKVERVDASLETKRDGVPAVQSALERLVERFQPIAEGPHRLSIIEEVE